MGKWQIIKSWLLEIVSMGDEVDVDEAAVRIKENIWFKGSNVWILVFSIIIASVGLNVNSTAVIIGAMLISPLMGPIIGVGLAVGTYDWNLLKDAARNLLVMVVISLVASSCYFLLSPLELVNPTELEARTSPTLFDVFIALAGGAAGILEGSRKQQAANAVAGVAIATALMPPLCTVGYGIANADLHFILGAAFLFVINCVFIATATFLGVKVFCFKQVEIGESEKLKGGNIWVKVIPALVLAGSIVLAFPFVSNNKFESNVQQFVSENKIVGKSYIFDYKIHSGHRHRSADIFFAGPGITEDEMANLYESAARYGIKAEQLKVLEHAMGGREEATDELLKTIYERSDMELSQKNARIRELEAEIEKNRAEAIPYVQITREIKYNYPEVTKVTIGRGAHVDDSLNVHGCISVVATSNKPMKNASVRKLEEWVRIRLNDSTAVVSNVVAK